MNLNIFKKLFTNTEIQKPNTSKEKRSFSGSLPSRFVNWIYGESYSKINLDLDTGLIKLIERTRELAKNNAIVRSYLELMDKNVIGKSGFTLQSQIKDTKGKLDTELNDFIEWEYYDWQKASNGFLTIDGETGGKDFDKLILRTLLIDGEVFIRVHKSRSNPYGISFSIIDAKSIDFTKRREFSGNQNAIVLGVEIDRNYKPVAYWAKPRYNCCISSR